MESSCPNCKKKNEHEDYLFEVACTCGSRYNPFMQLEEAPAAGAESAAAAPQFAEANDAFADIRNFGDENVSSAAVPPEPEAGFTDLAAPAPAGSKAAPIPSSTSSSAPRPSDGASFAAGPVSAGQHFASLLEPLPPVSACVDFDSSLPNALSPLIDELWNQAASAGGSACTELRWAFSPDGQKILGSCIPVRRA